MTTSSTIDICPVGDLGSKKGQFSVKVTPDYGIAGSISGGVLTGLAIKTARQYLSGEGISSAVPHVLSYYIQFFSRTRPGTTYVSCSDLSRSASQAVIKVEFKAQSDSTELASGGEHSGNLGVVAIITFANMHDEKGLSQPTTSQVLENVPDRKTDSLEVNDEYMHLTPMTKKFRWWSPRKPTLQHDGLWGHFGGGHTRDVFISPSDGSSIGECKLAWIVDLAFQPPLTYELHLASQWRVATLSIAAEFKKPVPDNLEWVLVRSTSHVISHGRYDLDVFLINPTDHTVLALARHVVYVRPLTMLSGRRGHSKEADLSKM